MLTAIEALAIGSKLTHAFDRVVVDQKDNYFASITATGHKVMPAPQRCRHAVKLEARNVTVAVDKQGYLVSSEATMLCNRVVFCQRCDFVLYYEGWVP